MMKKLLIALTLLVGCGSFMIESMQASNVVRQEVTASEPSVMARRGAIDIACPADGKAYTFQIFSITGQLIKKVQLCDGRTSIDLAKGCYVVRCEVWVKKIVVG